MQLKLLEILACPKCRGGLDCRSDQTGPQGEVAEGSLACAACAVVYPIINGIPRFVPTEQYAGSFGYQWNQFKLEQIDSNNGTSQSRDRLFAETGWDPQWLAGKWVLEAGCGAGRFLDVLGGTECQVVGVDISSAIDAAKSTVGAAPNVHFVQASIFELPFRDGSLDGCYSIGVMQHTPDPERALRALPRLLKAGGRLAVTIYERKPYTLLNGKYLVRPLTRRIPDRTLLAMIRAVMPVVFPLTEVLFRLPVLGHGFRFVMPVCNYVEKKDLSIGQRYRWAVLDTFDMLSPTYDAPQRESDARRALAAEGVREVSRLANPGLNLVGVR